MKKIILIVCIAFFARSASGQAYLGTVVKPASLRAGAGTQFRSLATLQPGRQVFIISLEADNDFYNIIDITTNKEGFIHRSLVNPGKQVTANNAGLFTPDGASSSEAPEIEIYNNTSLKLTLKLGEEVYYFLPKERRILTLSAGSYAYRASAAGVIPNIGSEFLETRVRYTWQFYLVTRRG